MSFPQTIYTGLDANYRPTYRVTTLTERMAYLDGQAKMWDRNAAEHEASADRWAARGDQISAARCLATGKDYRAHAEQCRQEAAAMAPVPLQHAAE
jgi:hypothetical protein